VKFAIHVLFMASLAMSIATAAPAKGKASAASAVSPKAAAVATGDPVAGREKADSERCFECHGIDGNGVGQPNPDGSVGRFAKLAGQYPGYVIKQIRDLRSGARKHDQMAIMARSVSDEDLVDIAAYFGSLPVMKGAGDAGSELAKNLFLKGDPARGITACASCHGDKGKGQPGAPLMPVIGGQEPRYLEKQLLEWRSGERHNSPEGLMNKGTKSLTDAEIQALVAYLSGL
jgi:cytochrome c553